jgi:hypothetical protein
MHLSSSSAAGVRFLTSVREGRGLNRSAREAGIGKETGDRWLREAYVAYRRGGKSIAETDAVKGLASAKSRTEPPYRRRREGDAYRGPPPAVQLELDPSVRV